VSNRTVDSTNVFLAFLNPAIVTAEWNGGFPTLIASLDDIKAAGRG
jgi:hypothetical protein